jgi:hypothetical protein
MIVLAILAALLPCPLRLWENATARAIHASHIPPRAQGKLLVELGIIRPVMQQERVRELIDAPAAMMGNGFGFTEVYFEYGLVLTYDTSMVLTGDTKGFVTAGVGILPEDEGRRGWPER